MVNPLSALTIAAYVVQFLDLANSTVSTTRSQHKTNHVSSQSDIDPALTAKRLHALAKKLSIPLDSDCSSTGSGSSNETSTPTARLQEICQKCREVSQQLGVQLGKVGSPTEAGKGKWKSFKQSLKAVGTQQELDDISKKLGDLRDSIGFKIMSLLKQQASTPSIQQDSQFKALDLTTQMIINGWLKQRTEFCGGKTQSGSGSGRRDDHLFAMQFWG